MAPFTSFICKHIYLVEGRKFGTQTFCLKSLFGLKDVRLLLLAHLKSCLKVHDGALTQDKASFRPLTALATSLCMWAGDGALHALHLRAHVPEPTQGPPAEQPGVRALA